MAGLGWDASGNNGQDESIDLDASCLLFDDKGQLKDAIFFNRLENESHSVRHSGDNLTGDGEGDDEKLYFDLASIPQDVCAMYVTVHSYSGQSLNVVKNAHIRIVNLEDDQKNQKDAKSKNELIRFEIGQGSKCADETALLMVKIWRQNQSDDEKSKVSGPWKMKALGVPCVGRMYKDSIKDCQEELAGKLKLTHRFNSMEIDRQKMIREEVSSSKQCCRTQ